MDRKFLLLASSVSAAIGAWHSGARAQGLEEVIVTAQRREEALLDTPLTVTAVTGDTLEEQNVRDLTQLTALVPGLEIEPDGGRTSIRLRGIATADGGPAAENVAALHVDGVYLSHRTSLDGYFYDVERVEVLQGPQGTLYGRNTAAGTVNIITRRPVQESEGSVELDIGNYDRQRLFGMLNVPLTDRFAVRGAFQTITRGGYFESGIDEERSTYGRLGLQWDPTDRLSIFTKFDFGRRWRKGTGVALLGTVDNTDPDNWIATPLDEDQYYFDDRTAHPEDHRGFPATEPFDWIDSSSITDDSVGMMTEIEYRFADNVSLIANLARMEDDHVAFAVGLDGERAYCSGACWGGTVGQRVKGTPWVENVYDLRLQGRALDQIDWTLGAFYWDDDTNEPGDNPDGIAFNAAVSLAESKAIYGQATWTPRANERLHLTVGGRKTNDWREWDFQVQLFNLFAVGGSGGPQVKEWDNTDYKLGIAWDLGNDGDRGMIYSNISSGYRAGSWFAGPIPYYDPEYIDAFELGWKGRLADDRLELNVNAYFYDYQDVAIQFDSFNTISMEQEFSYTNLGSAEVTGANLSGAYLAGDNDIVTFNLDYTDAEITEFDFESVLAEFPPIYSLDNVFDWTGLQIPNTTPWRLTLAWDHRFEMGGRGELTSRVQTVWNDERYSGYRETTQVQYEFPGYLIDSYVTLDWNVNYRPADANWRLGFYVLNLTDERIPTAISGGGNPPTGPLSLIPVPNGDDAYYTGQLRAPRTFGFRIGYDF